MVQNPKGGGLSSSFGGGGTQQLGGVQKTTDFLDKSTWFLAIFLIALILASNFAIDNSNESIESKALNTDEVNTQALPFDDSQGLSLPSKED
jgi:preprotein translocase subunit SecG